MKVVVAAGLAVAFAIGLGACEKKSASVAPAASSLAPSVAAPSSKTLKFAIDPKSTTWIDMPAPKEHIKASTDGATGTLEVDVTDLSNTRGEVRVDLTTLTTKTFDDPDKNKAQTTHARTWLEVADGEEGKLPEELKAQHRYAVYAIRSLDALSATDLSKVSATKDGADDVRSVRLTSHGELLIHGHKVDLDAELEVQFRYLGGADVAKPRAIVIKTRKPLRATLADYDVRPRDGFGKIAKGAFNLLGTKVADVADISLDLRATPQS